MINRIISLGFLIFIGITCALLYFVALIIWCLTYLFDKRLVALHLFSSFWASIYIWLMPAWSVTKSGKQNIDKNETYVVVSNHQSQLDILVAFNLFFHFKWVSKIEVFNLPFIGWNMRLNKYIRLKRGDVESTKQMLSDCETTLKRGSSVYFFPEGTRSASGLMKPFKSGAFVLAKKMKRPILPIAINGTKNALPKNSLNFHGKQNIRIQILNPIPYSEFENLTIEEISKRTWNTISGYIDEHKNTVN